MNKYEQLIEHIINDQNDEARELFHTIVVEKSRDIYENLIDDADLSEVATDEVSDLVDEINVDEQGISEEEHDEEEDDEVSMDMDVDAEEAPAEEEIEDRVVDLEDALDELKAEFDALMGGEAEEVPGEEVPGEEMVGMEVPSEEEMPMAEATESEEEVVEEDEEVVEEDEEIVREYVEKVPAPAKTEQGAQTKSPVAGKNDMGGKPVDMSAGGNVDQDGAKPATAPKPKGQLVNDPLNKPGAKAGKAFDKKETADNTQASGTDTKSPVGK